MDELSAEIRTNTGNALAASSSAVCEAIDGKHGLSVLHQQQNNEWCDVILFAKGAMVGIKGHKMILASASPHLRDAFKSKGFVDSGAKEYYVEQLDHETLQVIVDFIYSSTLRVAGGGIGDRLGSVLIGADYLLMPDLVHICGQSLAHPAYLNAGSSVRMWLFARKYHCKVLEDAAVGTMATDLRAVAEHDDYSRLEKANVVTLLSSLMMAPPDLVCEAAIAWLGYIEEERKADCDEIMRQVPLKAVSVNALQRASQAMFLSEQALWMIQQVQEVRAEVDKAKLEISVMTNDLSVANDKFAKAKLLATNRRQHLGKMIEQANTMDRSAITFFQAETINDRAYSWVLDDKKERLQARSEASAYVSSQLGIDC